MFLHSLNIILVFVCYSAALSIKINRFQSEGQA